MALTQAEFRALLALNRHKLKRRLPRPALPDAQARLYARALKKILKSAMEMIQAELLPVLKRIAPTQVKVDALALDAKLEIGEAIDRVEEQFWKKWTRKRMAGLVQPAAEDTARFQAQNLNAQLRPVVGLDVVGSEPWLEPVVEDFVARNVALIKSIPTRFFDEVETAVTREASQGERWENLAKTIEDRWGVSQSRAKLIARDQVGKFYGELNRTRQRGLGIRKATWRTVNDNRVREEHGELNGTVYDLSKPPEGGPGQPVNCRCYDDPDLESALAD